MSDEITARLPASEPLERLRAALPGWTVWRAGFVVVAERECVSNAAIKLTAWGADDAAVDALLKAWADAMRAVVERAATEAYTAGARQKAADDGEDCHIVTPADIAAIVDRILGGPR